MTTATAAVDAVLDLAARWQRPDEADLVQEYERLFVGPGRVPCPPYESLWREDVPARLQGSLLGPCVPDLLACYEGLGVRPVEAAHELPDHIVAELEALALALSHPAYRPVAAALVHDHLARWLPTFCDAVVEHAEGAHYRQLAESTLRYVVDLDNALQPPDG